jgi:hypothetical protein
MLLIATKSHGLFRDLYPRQHIIVSNIYSQRYNQQRATANLFVHHSRKQHPHSHTRSIHTHYYILLRSILQSLVFSTARCLYSNMAAPQSNNKFSSSEFAKCMSVFVGGLGATAIAIGKTGELASRAATRTSVRLHPTLNTYPLPQMVPPPTTGLVANCLFTSCCATAAVMTYVQGVYGPSHFEQPRTLTK